MHLSTPAPNPCTRIAPSGPASRFRWFAIVALILSVCGAGASFAADAGPTDLVTPPAPRQVAPLISGTYPNDADGDGIDDALQDPTNTAGSFSAQAAPADNSVKVELVFTDPVTQQQIDAFIALGGQVTYMYKTVSYGWNGRIDAGAVALLPDVMGPSLVLVKPVRKLDPYMDIATQNARVRPVWKPGFAGTVDGFDGDPSITIGIAVDGVDNIHPDLAGRCAYWSDLSDDREPNPVDHTGHGTLAAGIAVGTGQADDVEAPKLRYTHVSTWPFWQHVVDPITFVSNTFIELTSEATWTGGSCELFHVRWFRGSSFEDFDVINWWIRGMPDLSLTNNYMHRDQQVLSMILNDYTQSQFVDNVVITNTVSPYPSVDDGYSRFRGVAPACKWAAARLYGNEGLGEADELGPTLDDLVLHRKANNIKIINISFGVLDDEGLPAEDLSLRDKVNSAVHNGVIVVAAAGNSADEPLEPFRNMADPARAALAITVGASNDMNTLAYYSTHGYTDPRSDKDEDYKPDIIAPGGSWRHSGIMSVDSQSSDGFGTPDKQPNDYANSFGTSFASPFVAGCAALVIDALQQQGIAWDFDSDELPRFVKMVLCATATETNARREDWFLDPSLQRAAGGPNGFPAAKDPYEGYGLINADAAVEAVWRTYVPTQDTSAELGGGLTDRRAWARKLTLAAGAGIETSLDNPSGGDFDLYLYSAAPSETGAPVILASSTKSGTGVDEDLSYIPDADTPALLVVKRVSGSGTFKIESTLPGPPIAQDVSASARHGSDTTIRLQAEDDGAPNPPGALTFVIASLPKHGSLLHVDNGAAITKAPTSLGQGADQVVYRPDTDYVGQDTFTFRADDGGVAPAGGQSNAGTVTLTVRAAATQTQTVELSVSRAEDDGTTTCAFSFNSLFGERLRVGTERTGIRFLNVPIPRGSEIVDARLKLRCYSQTIPDLIDGVIQAEATDDAAELNGFDRHLCKLPLTQASTSWPWEPGYYSFGWDTSPDLSAVLQEIVDRGGWSTGNAMVIVYWSQTAVGRDREFNSYDNWASDPVHAPKLVVTYAQ